MNYKDFWKDIPLDRNDEKCPNCGSGHLREIPARRSLDVHLIQNAFNCINCKALVIIIVELYDQMCPFCGSESVLTVSQLEEIKIKHNS